MRSSVDMAPSPSSQGTTTTTTTTNQNNNNGNSGSQYALCALGVGLVALGVVMIVWSVVPAEAAGNSSSSSGGAGGVKPGNRNKASSVAFVLVGSGVVMLLLALCLGMRNKQREQRHLEAQNAGLGGAAAGEPGTGETAEERAERFAVPSYEEAVCSGQYPVRESNLQHSTSQLPSYDDLVRVDGVQYEFEGLDASPAGTQPPPAPTSAGPAAAVPVPAAVPSNRRAAKTSRKLLPLKIRRIKSEKLHVKNADNSQPAAGISIEPLTPPPQYEDKVPQL